MPAGRVPDRLPIITVLCAGQKSLQKKGKSSNTKSNDPGNQTVNFHGEKRTNDTHQSTTYPEESDPAADLVHLTSHPRPLSRDGPGGG
jgi:hypothetical protein